MRCGLRPAECITDHWCPVLDGRATTEGAQWSATCPGCRERKLSIGVGDRARIVWLCHRGCSISRADLIAAGIADICLPQPTAGRHRKAGDSAETKQLVDFITTEKLPAAALRLGLLIEMGMPATEARDRLNLTKTTYYRAMKQVTDR